MKPRLRLFWPKPDREQPEGLHEREMTVCIGAVSWADDKYVSVSDKQLTYGNAIQGTGFAKVNLVGERCIYAFSGAETQAFEVWATAVNTLDGKPKTVSSIKSAFEGAYMLRRDEWLSTHLRNYGLGLKEFVANGRQYFGGRMFREMWEQLDNVWSVDILLGGFEETSGRGFVMSVHAPGQVNLYLARQVSAIGSGSSAALTLLSHTYDHRLPTNELTARLLEAKFVSETNPYVGPDTVVWTVDKDGKKWVMPAADIRKVRDLWKQHGKNYTSEAATLIGQLNKPGTS